MSFLSNFFGSKKPQEQEVKAKTSSASKEPSPLPTIMHDDLDILRQYVDKNTPVLIIGGEYHQKQVILTSNPKATVFEQRSTGKKWPGVTIEKVSGISMDEPEESKPSVPTKPQASEKAEPTAPIKQSPATTALPQLKEQQLTCNPIHIYKDPVTGEIVEETDEEYQRKQKEQQKKEKKRPELVFPEEIEHPTMGERFDEYCASLPPFDFYEGDNESLIPEDAESKIQEFLVTQAKCLAICEECFQNRDYDAAEANYLLFIGNGAWEPEACNGLMRVYSRKGEAEKLEAARLYAIDHFTKRRERMERQLIALAEQLGDKTLATVPIRKGEKVAYFRGLFTLYDPFPCIEQWKQIDTTGTFLLLPF